MLGPLHLWLQNLLRQTRSVLSIGLSDMPPDERRLCAEHEAKNTYAIARAIFPWAAPALFISVLPCLWLPPPYERIILCVTHLIAGLLIMAWGPVQRTTRLDGRWLLLIIELTALVGYGEAAQAALRAGPDVISFLFANILYVAAMLLCLLLYPFANGSVFLAALTAVLIGAVAWRGDPFHKMTDWVVVESAIALFGIGIYYASVQRRRRQLQAELATRRFMVQSERSRLALVEQDLSLAGEMQDSFNSAAPIHAGQHFKANYFQEKFGVLSGDWMATKTLANGDFVVVVADATGKGVRAAMVTQALQTLWLNNLAASDFDPTAWINAVNRTLLGLGVRREHTLTMGLLLIRGDLLTYYSAAHVPLFLVCRPERTDTVQVLPLLARGSLLGMHPVVELNPVSINLVKAEVDSVLLGTDGVFERGARTRQQAVVKLAADLEAHGVKALARCPAADDKLVVWLQRQRPAQSKQSATLA